MKCCVAPGGGTSSRSLLGYSPQVIQLGSAFTTSSSQLVQQSSNVFGSAPLSAWANAHQDCMYHHQNKGCPPHDQVTIGNLLTISSNGVLIQGSSNTSNVSIFVTNTGTYFSGPVYGLGGSNGGNGGNGGNTTTSNNNACAMCDGNNNGTGHSLEKSNIAATHELLGDVIISDKLYVTNTLTVPAVDLDSLVVYNRGTCHSWNMFVTESNDLAFRSKYNTLVTLCEEFETGVLSFTGSHLLHVAEEELALKPGHIVVSTGVFRDAITGRLGIRMDDALPVVTLSDHKGQRSAFGVFSRWEENRCYKLGSLRFPMPHVSDGAQQQPLAQVNSAGEGCILVNGEEGDFQNGDLIQCSSQPGVGCRQPDDVVRSCTVAKITCDCVFGSSKDANKLVGCVYKF